MNTTLELIVITGSLILVAPALSAQTTNNSNSTNNLPLAQTLKYQVAVETDRALGEEALLSPGLKEKMRLTSEQRTELKLYEDDFANTSRLYKKANEPRIEAALESCRQARASKDDAQIRAARKQLQEVWAGLQPDRVAATARIKALLTPAQLAILEDPKNEWRENHVNEANDPSAN